MSSIWHKHRGICESLGQMSPLHLLSAFCSIDLMVLVNLELGHCKRFGVVVPGDGDDSFCTFAG